MKNKIYLIYFNWANTSGNHAGMGYLCRKLENDLAYVVAIKMFSPKNRYLRIFNVFYVLYLAIYFKINLKNGDKVVLMEFLAKSAFQDFMLKVMKFLKVSNKIYGLIHLSGDHLLELYGSKSRIRRKVEKLDKIIVFGSSLKYFLSNEIGYDENRILLSYHYVDTEFYNYSEVSQSKLSVIALGNIKRDFVLLESLVKSLPNIHFNICMGMRDLSPIFSKHDNVKLYGFIEEEHLRTLMHESDVSLSIMEDTVGSNVITTTMASGLIQVVSDVGSIRDYCKEDISFFCKSKEDFVRSLSYLSTLNLTEKTELKFKTRNEALSFSYDCFVNDFNKIFDDE